MEPITAVATILQLVGVFRQEAGRRDDLTSNEFMAWLETHRHNELKDIITNTFHLQDQVNDLLRKEHDQILSELHNLSDLIVSLSKRFEDIASLAEAAPPEYRLPDQAVSILATMRCAGAEGLEIIPQAGMVVTLLIPSGKGGTESVETSGNTGGNCARVSCKL